MTSIKAAAILLVCFATAACIGNLAAQESPSGDVFPSPYPSPKAFTIEVRRNEQGLPVRSEDSHEEVAAHVRDYLQSQYLPKVREHYPDTASIKLAGRPSVDGLGVHEIFVYARWGVGSDTMRYPSSMLRSEGGKVGVAHCWGFDQRLEGYEAPFLLEMKFVVLNMS